MTSSDHWNKVLQNHVIRDLEVRTCLCAIAFMEEGTPQNLAAPVS